ncbi:hypothetical protein ALC60_09944, partial [Trachymyrmex zeteki]
DAEVLKLLVDRESERRSIATINEEQEHNESKESIICVDTPIVDEAKKESYIWPDEAVLLFLEIYRNKEPTFALGLKRYNKIWLEIANEMKMANYNVTVVQCQNKMSGLKRTYKNISDSNKKSGNHSSSWAFYSAMDSIFGEKAWVAPISTASSDDLCFPSTSSTLSEISVDEQKPKKRRVESILESFITEMKKDKQKQRDEREQRRVEKKAEKEEGQKQIVQEQWKMHQDKVKLQQSLIEVLSKVVERKKEEVTEEVIMVYNKLQTSLSITMLCDSQSETLLIIIDTSD